MVLSFFVSCQTRSAIDKEYDNAVETCYLLIILSASQSSSSSSSSSSSYSPGSSFGSTCLKDAARKRSQARSRNLL